jgi:hypothetical protein
VLLLLTQLTRAMRATAAQTESHASGQFSPAASGGSRAVAGQRGSEANCLIPLFAVHP